MILEGILAGITAVSVVVGIYFGLKNHQLQKRLLEIEEQRIEERRGARLTIQFHYDGKRRVLRICNVGSGEARNIRLRLDGVDAVEHPCWVKEQRPVSTISGENYVDCLVFLTMRNPTPREAQVLWDDDVSLSKSSRSTLTL